MRSADLPTAPFFREPKRIKKGAKKPNEKHFVTFDSELIRLKSNKKPFGVRIVLYVAILSHRMDFMADKTYWYANCFICCKLSLIKLCKWKIEKGYVL